MKPEEIKRLVTKSENDAVEFKRARGGVPVDFWPSYSSFANVDGSIVIDKYPKRLEVSNPGTLRMSKSVAIAGGTSDARNGKIFNIFVVPSAEYARLAQPPKQVSDEQKTDATCEKIFELVKNI